MWGKEVVFWQLIEEAVLVCLYKLWRENTKAVLAVGIRVKGMQLIGKDKNCLAGLQLIFGLIDCYRHLAVNYRNQLKARMQMHRKTEIMSSLYFEKVTVKRIFRFVKHIPVSPLKSYNLSIHYILFGEICQCVFDKMKARYEQGGALWNIT